MNRRFLTLLALVGSTVPALCAPDKDPSAAKPDKPRLQISPPAASDSGTSRLEVGQRGVHGNPLADGPSQVVATFFGALQEGKIDEGYATLTKLSKIAEKPEELKQLKAKTREAIEVFGNISGYDFVESRSIGQRLVRATYVSLGKVFPLRWRFYFYKSEDTWRLIDMRVDDKLTGIFDEQEDAKPADATVP